jgi:hypothetical protein
MRVAWLRGKTVKLITDDTLLEYVVRHTTRTR